MDTDSANGRNVITGEFEFMKFADGGYYINTPNGTFSFHSVKNKFEENDFCILCFGFYEPFPKLPCDRVFAFVPKGRPEDPFSKETRWDIFKAKGTLANPVRVLYKAS